ncbi:MAG: zinc ribbon domain-containing protein [Pseudonocardiaceae bacterium]
MLRPVPRYEFRCQECSATFEVSRSMTASGEPAECPSGHGNTVRLLSTVALSVGALSVGALSGATPERAAAPGAGGCCGGGCCG